MTKIGPKDKSDIITSWIGVLFLTIGGAVTIGTYMNDVHKRLTDRQNAVFDLIATYNEPAMLDARAAFYKIKESAFQEALAKAPKQGNQEAVVQATEQYLHQAAVRLISQQGSGLSMRQLVSFLDTVGLCVKAGLCDKEAARQIFKEDAYEYSYILADFVSSVQKTRPTFGSEMQELAAASVDATK